MGVGFDSKTTNPTWDNNKMSKLSQLKRWLAVGVCGLAAATGAQAADKVYRLKMAETWPTNFPIFGDAPRNMAAMAGTTWATPRLITGKARCQTPCISPPCHLV